MKALRRPDGVWELDEPYSNDEVDIFRVFMQWKIGTWSDLTRARPTVSYYLPIGTDPRIIPIDRSSINGGRSDAAFFQPQRPALPAKKPKDPTQPKKKPPSDPKPKNDRSQRVKVPLNAQVPLPIIQAVSNQASDDQEWESWDIFN
jgi:hypothetical protein